MTSNWRSRLPLFLALAALFFAVLLPPEAYPDGKMAVILCATIAFFAAISEKRIASAYLTAGLALFGYLTAHSVFVSVDAFRSLEFMTVIWAYYCLFGFFLYSGDETPRYFATAMVTLSAIVAGYGLYQYFWGFEALERLIMHSGSGEIVKAPALARVSTRRIFSTLALPGTLWGFLVMALPFHLMLFGRRRYLNALLAGGIALSLTAGFLTRSFGLLLGITVASAFWMLAGGAGARWKRLTMVLLAAGVCGVMFYSVRRATIQTDDPMALRFLNWVSAWQMFSTHGMGTGLNTFGVVYTQHMMPGANETQYAHNTVLQILAELGYPALIAAAVGLLLLARRKAADSGVAGRALTAGLAVWGLHNAIDIDVYFPSVGITGVVIAALFLTRFHQTPDELRLPSRSLQAAAGAIGVVVILFAGGAFIAAELKQRAQVEYQERKPAEAIETLKLAQTFMPLDSSLFHDAGEILLDMSQRTRKPEHLEAATASFKRAITLSPQKVGPHIGYGLCLSQDGRIDDALAEVAVAQSLYPRGAYTRSITKILKERKAGKPIPQALGSVAQSQ